MSKQRDVLWQIEPHTVAKHRILKAYLDAWLPIMSTWAPRLLYIDGFAGPGRYLGGEEGSPIIAVNSVLRREKPVGCPVDFLFIEDDDDRIKHLRSEVGQLPLTDLTRVRYRHGRFDAVLYEELTRLESSGPKPYPLFAFVDPFGWQIPFSSITRLMKNPQSEVFVNFMYEEINRFISHPNQSNAWDDLFGTIQWRDCAGLKRPADRFTCISQLYRAQLLHAAHANYVLSFEMRNLSNRPDYLLYFATQNQKGLGKMKEAMWQVDRSGRFVFSDTEAGQGPRLIEDEPDFAQLRALITGRFAGSQVPIEEVEQFVVEQTKFLATHYKTHVLRSMEKEDPPGIAATHPGGNRRRGSFPNGTMVRFL